MNCWICGNIANSKEHRFKASDIKRIYGKKFNGFHVKGTNSTPIKSYKDRTLKFPEIICEYCNITRTREHDEAYDVFSKYCFENYQSLLSEKEINFKAIYKANWKNEKRNLYKYFAKHAGCKIYISNQKKDLTDLSNFILGKSETLKFVLYFELKMIIKALHDFYNKKSKYGHLYNSPTIYYGNTESLTFAGWVSNNWITTNWVYSSKANKILNFNKSIENIAIIKLGDKYNEILENTLNYDDYIHKIENGTLDSFDKKIEHFNKIIN